MHQQGLDQWLVQAMPASNNPLNANLLSRWLR
ncbi:hypothetical protein HNO88_004249 [Novosphingobium chloroacetimidivorans]|uniref:Uncharacterized protein n=1 Tax=Novosphingobium chloroacetimidivorans TaxID=1428314 RepID=A0A7W7NXP3_9SPHN|nr:hypothetical protein [Novosphingobium chloroacetimidivorans]